MHLRSVILYVAGPYGSYGEIENNIKTATAYAQGLWNAGFTVICPHTNTAHFPHNFMISEQDYLEGYLYILPRCDGIVLLPDWRKSSGAVKEKAVAEEISLPIFDSSQDATVDSIKQYFENK